MSFLSKIFGGQRSALDKFSKELLEVNGYGDGVAKLTQGAIQGEIKDLRFKIEELKTEKEIFEYLQEIAPRVFALVREAAKRSINQSHYDVQLAGGFSLSQGKIAEMKTGEGKTLTATLPLALYALAGKGAHLVTVNDYLARW